MIELAPRHKFGLALENPIMTASGCFGYGSEYGKLVDVTRLGAIVTNPVTLRPRRGPRQPRLAETRDGIVLNTGDENPGVRRIIQRYANVWKRMGVPVIVHLAPDDVDDLARTARALASLDVIAGLEVGLPDDSSPDEAAELVAAAGESELPILAKLPLANGIRLAIACVEAGLDALVVAAPPAGAAIYGSDQIISGRFYGPALHPLVMHTLLELSTAVDVPLVGCGGVHSFADAFALLNAGAVAVQVDSAIFGDPSLLGRLVEAWGEST